MSQLIEHAKHNLDVLRTQRARLFKAFDIYKDNVNYGLISETKAQHDEIVSWYNKALDLDQEAIENIPEPIKKYL